MANTATKQTNGLGTKNDIKKDENLPKEPGQTHTFIFRTLSKYS